MTTTEDRIERLERVLDSLVEKLEARFDTLDAGVVNLDKKVSDLVKWAFDRPNSANY